MSLQNNSQKKKRFLPIFHQCVERREGKAWFVGIIIQAIVKSLFGMFLSPENRRLSDTVFEALPFLLVTIVLGYDLTSWLDIFPMF